MRLPFSPRFRHWLSCLTKTGGILLLVLAAVITLPFAINCFDEPLDQSTQVWLDYPGLTAPEPQNGYLALMALDARPAQPVATAAAVVRAHHAILADASKSHQETLPRYRAIHAQLLDPISTYMPSLADCKDDCHAYLLAHPGLIEKLSSLHAGMIGRYDSMLDYPAYAEDIPLDPDALPPNYGLAYKIGLLHMGKMAFALQKGDAQTAYKEWARHHRFWQMAVAGSITLKGFRKVLSQLERSQALLSHMLAAHPESAAHARRHALPVLASRPQLAPVFARSLVHEFQIHAYILTHRIAQYSPWQIVTLGMLDEYPEGPLHRLALLFYQPNATMNLLHGVHQNSMAQNNVTLDGDAMEEIAEVTDACADKWIRDLLINPTGRRIVCAAWVDYPPDHGRIARADATAKDLEQKIRTQH
jgi:hypothetical protein